MITLRLDKNGGINKGDVQAFEHDNLSEVYIIQLYKNGAIYDLTNKSIELTMVERKRKIGDMVTLPIYNATEGKIKLEVVSDITKQDGIYDFKLTVKDTTGLIETFPSFQVKIENDITDHITGEIVQDKNFTILTEGLKALADYNIYKTNALKVPEIEQDIIEINSQLDTKANEIDLQTQKNRIDNIAKLEEGSTTGDAELIDARIGCDGTNYANAGDAIRGQYDLLHASLEGVKNLAVGIKEIVPTYYEGKYMNKKGGWSEDSNLHSKVTDKIVCSPGWTFSYKGKGASNAPSWIMYSGNTLVEVGFYNNSKVATEIQIPQSVDSIKFGSYNSLGSKVVLDVELLSCTQVTTANITTSLKSRIGVGQLDDNLKNIVEYDEIDISNSLRKIENIFLDYQGSIKENVNYDCYDLEVSEGDVFFYTGQVIYNLAPYFLYDSEDNIIEIGGDKTSHNTAINVTIEELIIPSSVTKLRVCSGGSSGRAEFTLKKLIPTSPLTKNTVGDLIESHKYEGLGDYIDITGNYEVVTGAYMNKSNAIIEDANSQYTEYIPLSDFNTIYISAHSRYSTCIMVILDASKSVLGSKGAALDEGETKWDLKTFTRSGLLEEYPTAHYIRLCTYKYNKYPLKLCVKKSSIAEIMEYIQSSTIKSNVLYGKKWVACGDSFTEGDFNGYVDENGLSGKNSPVIYDAIRGMYKTYPWWIAERNNITLINEAKCGSDFTNIEGASNPFSVSRYQAVPKDADYITLMFGLNETDLTTEQIGAKTDTTNATLWGAYNIVFEYFLTNMPYAKIGVIIADAWMNETYSNAVKSICAYWGIPVLDLKFDTNIPMGLSGRPNGSYKARQLRDSAFMVTSTNNHPNLEAHKYRSTIIEHWLRSL